MSKDRRGNFFEDFSLGMVITHATPRTLTEGDRSLYIGLTGSRDVLSSAETAALAAGLEQRPLESLLVFNTAFGKTVPDISLNAVANLGYADVRFLAPVYAGDTLAVQSEVIGLRENSNGKSGIVYVRSTAVKQSGEVALEWIRWVMVKKRQPGTTGMRDAIPELPPVVEASRLDASWLGGTVSNVVQATGIADLWEDYSVGERINHLSGMTINDSDHSIATRLYQNTAKAHFDGALMRSAPSGKRLVYGGHIMSLCKALSYDGFENALSILAINGGSHVAPSYAGDTIYCATHVVDKHELSNPWVGALRLRLIGAKNVEDVTSIRFPEAGQGRPAHDDSVVLDLDYTIAIPRKLL